MNHTLHLVAIAKAAGILINWDDFSVFQNTSRRLPSVSEWKG